MKKKILPIFILLISLAFIGVGIAYAYLSSPVDKKNTEEIQIEIKSGYSSRKIAEVLEEKGLIRNKYIFLLELKIYKRGTLKAGTYSLNKSMTLKEIIDSLENSKGIALNVKITFREGETITDLAKVIEKNTNHTYDEVIEKLNSQEYLNELISEYWFLTEDILNENIYYPLEGYLAPNTYHFENKDTSIETIIKTMLDEEDKILSKYKDVVSKDPHYYLTMASITQLEGTNEENRKMIAGIFENRLNVGMNLGSDVTTYYAFQIKMTEPLDGSLFQTSNPYNTRAADMGGKMPVGPICNPDESSIISAVSPTENDYYYFVADSEKNIYYSRNDAEHQATIARLKKEGKWLW